MKSIKKYRILLVLTILASIFLISTNSKTISHLFNPNFDQNNNRNVKNAGFWVLSDFDIYVNGEWSSTNKTQPWCNGNGTWYDPYIIENVTIDGQGSWACMDIRNSDVFFEIRNCTLYNANGAGVYLNNVQNGKFFDLNCTQAEMGINAEDCKNFTLSRINSTYNRFGIWFVNSHNNTFDNIYCAFNQDYGFFLWNCNDNNLTIINIHNHSGYGIGFQESHNNELTNSTISNNGNGLNLIWSNENSFSDLNISNSPYWQKYLNYEYATGINCHDCINSTFENNTIINHLGTAIDLDGCNSSNIKANNLTGENFIGIQIFDSWYSNFSYNRMDNCGILFYPLTEENPKSIKIEKTNTVNGNPVYYYADKNGLYSENFSSPGQIILANCNNSLISDLNISGTSEGISMIYCTNNTIFNNSLSFSRVGIRSRNGINNSIIANVGNNILYEGISINNEIDCNITGNVLSVLSETHGYGIRISGLNCTLTNNSLKNCGIDFGGSPTNLNSYNVDTSNTVNNKPIYFYYNQNSLDANAFNNAGQIYLSRCNYSHISDVNVSKGSIGIYLYDCTDVLISHINASYNIKTGMYIRSSKNINISDNNIIQNAEWGIIINYSFNNTISNNIIADNPEYGIYLFYENDNNTISLNNITSNNIGIYAYRSDNNTFYGNNFIGNTEHAKDDDSINSWNSTYLGNYWDNYTDNDLNPKDGIGDISYVISGSSNSEDYKPVMGPIWGDLDGDGLSNLEELTPGSDTFVTNASNPDSDYDGMYDGWEITYSFNPLVNDSMNDPDFDGLINVYEFIYHTNPRWNDTDNDGMPDGWEVFNGLNATNDTDDLIDTDNDLLLNLYEYLNGTDPQNADTDFDNIPDGWEIFNGLDPNNGTDYLLDTDNDFLLNLYEYLNGTDPQNADCDGDAFLDGIEVNLNTNPLNRWWYPMPNLEILDFKAKAAKENEPFTLNFTIINNGIWRAEDVVIRIKLELGNLTLWDNFDDPIDLEVDETYQDLIQIEGVTTSGGLVMLLELDPLDSINETYSSKDGSIRKGAEDNTVKEELQITGEELPGNGGIDLIWIILIIIGAVAFAGTISSYVVLRPRIKRRAAFKRQIEAAKTEIENFETNINSFIKFKLRDAYKKQWWEVGIPLYIKNTIDKKLKTVKPKKPEISIDKMDLLDFIHYSSIITSQDNWEQIFSPIFSDKSEVESNFENIRVFKKDLYEGTITLDDIRNFPLFIHAIGNLITERFNIFLSYSTLDSEYYNIKEIASQLESYPKIDKVLYWEVDSGEDIVKYMERTLRISKVFVLFCSEKSFKSKAVEDEWHSAFQLRKEGKMKIVPVYAQEEYIPYLLKPLLNVKFDKDNFDEFVRKLYEEILR